MELRVVSELVSNLHSRLKSCGNWLAQCKHTAAQQQSTWLHWQCPTGSAQLWQAANTGGTVRSGTGSLRPWDPQWGGPALSSQLG